MPISADVLKAVELLEQSERTDNAIQRAESFIQAILILDSHLKEHPDSPDNHYIENIRISHTRRLLRWLPSSSRQDSGIWLRYCACVFLVSHEVKKISLEDAELKKVYDDFWQSAPITDDPISFEDADYFLEFLKRYKEQ